MSDIIVSLGDCSTRIATHLLNFQEEKTDALFMTSYADCYPRILSVNYRQHHPGLVHARELREQVDWDHQSQLIHRGADEDLSDPRYSAGEEATVTRWADNPENAFHVRSQYQLPPHADSLKYSSYFNGYGDGYVSGAEKEGYFDSLRFLAEESGSLQAVHLLCDTADGFSGLGANLLEVLRDDFATTPCLVYACSDGSTQVEARRSDASIANVFNAPLLLNQALESAAMVVPLAPLNTAFSTRTGWLVDPLGPTYKNRACAVLAAALDCNFRLFRTRDLYSEGAAVTSGSGSWGLRDMLAEVTHRGEYPLCGVRLQLPYTYEKHSGQDRQQATAADSSDRLVDLSVPRDGTALSKTFTDVVTFRGVDSSAIKDEDHYAQRHQQPNQGRQRRPSSVSRLAIDSTAFPAYMLPNGLLLDRGDGGGGYCSAASAISTDSSLGTYLGAMSTGLSSASRAQIARTHFDANALEEVTERLLSISQRYV